MSMINFSEFEQMLGVTFEDQSILKRAFTHRSYINEHKGSGLAHNERLEFLGDAVLELVVTRYLFEKYPDSPEGELTSYRASLVNTITIAEAAADFGMGDFLLLSKGETRDTGRARQYILANTFEAVIGAMYLDQGYEAAHAFIEGTLFHKIDEIVKQGLWRDAKSLLQEQAQDKEGITPTYSVVSERGPDHDKDFLVAVFLKEEQIAQARGKSKQEAQQHAAAKALKIQGWELQA